MKKQRGFYVRRYAGVSSSLRAMPGIYPAMGEGEGVGVCTKTFRSVIGFIPSGKEIWFIPIGKPRRVRRKK